MRRNLVLLLALAVATVAFLPSIARSNDDNDLPTWQHSAKFLCGRADDDGPVVLGEYATAINVHNPNSHTVRGNASQPGGPSESLSFSPTFRKKALRLFPGEPETPTPPGPWFRPGQLPRDWGFEIDCRDIRTLLCPPSPKECVSPVFIKGFVVIEARSRLPLDVVAAYTTLGEPVSGEFAGGGRQNTVEIETVQPKKIRSG